MRAKTAELTELGHGHGVCFISLKKATKVTCQVCHIVGWAIRCSFRLDLTQGNSLTARQKKTTRKTLSLIAATFAVTYASMMMVQLIEPNELTATQIERTNAPMLSPDIDTDWRYTKNGWQQISVLYREEFAPIRTFESVHPFIWAATVMMAVVATTLWASSEWELARFHQRRDT